MKNFKGKMVSLLILTVLVGSIGLIYLNSSDIIEDTTIGAFATLEEDPDPAEH